MFGVREEVLVKRLKNATLFQIVRMGNQKTTSTERQVMSLKPIIKIPGGKRWLAPKIQKLWMEWVGQCEDELPRMIEPFGGGMAVSLHCLPKYAIIVDANPHLINLYRKIKMRLIKEEDPKVFPKTEKKYKRLRREFNKMIENDQHKSVTGAYAFLALNKTCFNGLIRFNSDGQFNVPWGKYDTSKMKGKSLRVYSSAFADWHFDFQDFTKTTVVKSDFVYADPPFDGGFADYTKEGFSWDDQVRCAEWLAKLPGAVVASNRATKRIVSLYRDLGFTLKKVSGPRSISCKGDGREPAVEMLALRNL